MDGQLRDVVRRLQAGPFVADTLEQVRQTLNALRSSGRAAEVKAQRADMVVLLDDFAEQARTPADAAAAHLLAADLCQAGGAQEHTVERLALALDLDPTNHDAAQLLERALSAPKDRPRLLALLSARAQALVTSDYVDDALASAALVQIGAIHAQGRDWDKAIDAYDRALELSPDVQVVETLAGLYERRHKPGDAEQAADLFCALYDVLPPEEGLPHVQHALRLVPGHAEARQRLQSARPVGNHGETKVGPAPRAPQASLPTPPPAVAPNPAGHSLVSGAPPQPAGPATSRPARRPREPASTPVVSPEPSQTLSSSRAPASPVVPQSSTPSASSIDSQARTLQMQPSVAAPAPSLSPATAAEAPSSAPPAALAQENTAGLGSGDMFSVVSASLASGRPPPEVTAEAALHRAQESKQKRMMAAIVAAVTLLAAVGAYALLSPSAEDTNTDVAAAVAPEASTLEAGDSPEGPLPEASAAAAPAQDAEGKSQVEAAPAQQAAPVAEAEADATDATNTAAAAPTMEPTTPTPAERVAAPRRRRARPEVSVLKAGAKIRGAKVDKKGFMAAMEKRLPRVERCYKQALRRDKKLEGRLVYGFKVRRNGRPMRIERIGGTIDNRRLDRCARKALSGTRFPRWKRGAAARVRLPLKFDK